MLPSHEVWRLPKLGFIKLNFDATFQSNFKTSPSAVLARDSEGKVVGAETYLFTNVVDAFVVEARACERTLFFASRMGFRCLVVERDSMTVIKKLFIPRRNNGAAPLWRWKGEEDSFLVFGSMVFLTRY